MASLNPLKMFSSAFEKIGLQAADNKSSAEANVLTATSVSVGGSLYNKLDEILVAIKELSGTAKKPDFKELASAGGGSFSMSDSIALAFLAPTLKPIGKGLGFIVDAVNNLQEGGEDKAKALEGIFGVLVKIGEVGKAIFAFAGWMVLALPFLMITAVASPLIAIALGATLMAVRLATKKLDEEQMNKIKMLGDVGKSIFIFAASLALTSLIMPWAIKGAVGAAMIIFGIGMVFMLLDEIGILDNIEQAGKGLQSAGLAILGLGVALALFSFIEPYAMKGFTSAMLMIAGVGLVMMLISGGEGDFESAAKGLAWAGLGIISLGLALWFFNYLDPSVGTFFKVLAFITGFGIAFAIIGESATEIKDGAQALLWASLSIIVIALSFQLMNLILGDSMKDPANYAGLLLVAGLAIGYKFIGMQAKHIKKGAMAMIAVGGSLIVIAIGMFIMSKALKENGWELLAMTAALLVGLGLAFAGAGLGAVFILPGAAAMAVAGVALITVGAGMMLMGKAYSSSAVKELVKADKDGNTPIKTLLMAVADGFNMWPWEAFGVLTGSASMIAAGAALMMVAGGLMMFGKASEKLDLDTIGGTISQMIGTLSIPFHAIGSGKTLNVIDPVTGEKTDITFSTNFWGGGSVYNGVKSVLKMGTALTNIAGGVQSMANLKFPTGFDKEGKATAFETIGGDAFEKVIKNTAMMVGALAIPFAKIGMGQEVTLTDPDSGEEYTIMIGGGGFFSDNVVKKGVDAVMDMGMAMSNLAGGVQNMAMLKFPTGFDKEGKATGFQAFDDGNALKVTQNTQMLVSALSGTFAEIGADPDSERGFWGGASTIEKGQEIVAGFGTPLVNLAQGVSDMANLRFAKEWDADGKAIAWHDMSDISGVTEKVKKNTILLITALTEVFTTVGGGDAQTGGWWSGESDFDKGIEIVNMIAEPYIKLTSSIGGINEAVNKYDANESVSKIKAFIGVFTEMAEGADVSMLNARRWMADSVGSTFEKLGVAIPLIVDSINGVNETTGSIFSSIFVGPTDPKNPIKGYESQTLLWKSIGSGVSTAGESMPKIAEGINAMDFDKLVESRKMFEALGVLASGGEPSDILAQMGESLEVALQNLADMLGDFKGAVSEQSASNGGFLESAGNAISSSIDGVKSAMGMDGGATTAAATAAAPDNTNVASAIKKLSRLLTESGIKIKEN